MKLTIILLVLCVVSLSLACSDKCKAKKKNAALQDACSELAGGTKIKLEIDIAGGGCRSPCGQKKKKKKNQAPSSPSSPISPSSEVSSEAAPSSASSEAAPSSASSEAAQANASSEAAPSTDASADAPQNGSPEGDAPAVDVDAPALDVEAAAEI